MAPLALALASVACLGAASLNGSWPALVVGLVDAVLAGACFLLGALP